MSPILPTLHDCAPLAAPRPRAPARRLPVLALAALLCATTAPLQPFGFTAQAQTFQQRDPNAQLLLKSDELIYDNDNEIVTARGNVQLDYDGYNVVADRVSYNQRTRRVKAFGNVEILEPDGNRIYADEIDLTDDFGEGFVNALRVETPDNTRFIAESAERKSGDRTVFNNGTYTACEPCKERPDRAPIWQVKAETVILDGVEKTVSYRNASFELFGLPIAYLPFFKHADPSVKRKTGFLTPKVGYDSDLGAFYRQAYFIETGDTHDLTVAATGYTEQGFMGEAQWRHQLENGFYTLRVAHIDQQSPERFSTAPESTLGSRTMFATSGEFTINPRWAFGWNILAQSDNNFARTYAMDDYTAQYITNDVHLRGLANRSYFDLSARQYLIQTNSLVPQGQAFSFESEQPLVLPVLDYNTVTNESVTGGEVSLDFNVTAIDRDRVDTNVKFGLLPTDPRTQGIDGNSVRVSADLAWQKAVETATGLVITPSLSLRGDFVNVDGTAAPAITGNSLDEGSSVRFMPTAGLEVRYPLLAVAANSTHVFEPIAQIFVRPELGYDGVLPNEDAQSLVFDTTTLFRRDKFSGYDRIEGSTRANIGFRYSGLYANGLTVDALVGQSFNLAGRNPYAREDDLTNVGEESGLESDRSDYVASLTLGNNSNSNMTLQGRFDERDFDLRRAELTVSHKSGDLSGSLSYAYIDAQPDYAFPDVRQQVVGGIKWSFAENWSIAAAATYDLEGSRFINDAVTLAYADECFTFSLNFAESHSTTLNADTDRSITFSVGFRTIGEFKQTIDADLLNQNTTNSF